VALLNGDVGARLVPRLWHKEVLVTRRCFRIDLSSKDRKLPLLIVTLPQQAVTPPKHHACP